MRKTFDRDYDLLRETPPSVNLPHGHELGRLRAVRKDVPLVAVHVFNDDPHPGRTGTALCGKRGEVADIVHYLFSAATYPFCGKCQEAAAQQLTTTPKGAQETDMSETPKRGRKKRAAELVHRHRSIRINDQEWHKIQAAAAKAGKGTTTWARDVLVAASEPA